MSGTDEPRRRTRQRPESRRQTDDGYEPQVGEIRAVRTFRIGPDGALFPLFGAESWCDGTNAAQCRIDPVAGDPDPHVAPVADCGCGYYAYGSEQAAREYPQARNVVAVVACWGRIVAGTRGLRCQYARIEAIWVSGRVPSGVSAAVSRCYPSATIYTSKASMYEDHPVTELECYENSSDRVPTALHWATWTTLALAGAATIPTQYWWSLASARIAWATALVVLLLWTIRGHRGNNEVARGRGRLLSFAGALWLLASVSEVTGWIFIRLPLVVIVGLVAAWHRSETAAANRFPAHIE